LIFRLTFTLHDKRMFSLNMLN